MADEMDSGKKRRTLGSISVARFQKLAEWKQFEAASQEFSSARQKVNASKNKFRETLKKHSQSLADIEHLDFVVSGKEITVFEKLGTGKRQRGQKEELD